MENNFIDKVYNIVVFEDGTFFNGVKGHLVRATKNWKDAKIIKELSDRDKRYLNEYKLKYLIIDVKMKIEPASFECQFALDDFLK